MQIYYKNEKYIFANDPTNLESYMFVFGKEKFHLKVNIHEERIYAKMANDHLTYYDEISFNMLDKRLTKNEILKAVLRDI